MKDVKFSSSYSDYEEYLDTLGYSEAPLQLAESSSVFSEGDSDKKEKFSALRNTACSCQLCPLAATRKNVVFGEGSESARLMFAGEAPGYYEDQKGRPFIGAAGELLTKMILAMGLRREDVYIANVLKCRPPENRDPRPEEIALCEPYLRSQIELIAPDVIVTLGTFASQVVLKNDLSISRMRARSWPLTLASGKNIQVFPTFHPAFLLRNSERKRDVWADLQGAMKILTESLR